MTIAALAPFRKQPTLRPVDDDFSALYREYHPQLIRYVTHHFGPRDADEITQEALTRALRAMERDRSGAETWAWLIRVARNVAHDLARSRRICEATDDDAVLASDLPDDALLPEPAALLDERRRLVRRALRSLPDTQRRILVLYEVDELNCPAIARLVGSNESAVRKALQRARTRFAAEMRALSGGALSVGFWFRGLRRRSAKMLPAASASTAMLAVVGTVAVTVSVAPPQRELSPKLAPPAASAYDDAAAVMDAKSSRDAARAASSLAVLSGSGRMDGKNFRRPPRTPEKLPSKVSVPHTPISPGADPTYVYVVADNPVTGRTRSRTDIQPSEENGVICSMPVLACE